MGNIHLVEEQVADGEDGLDACEQRLVLVVADGAQLPQRARVDVVDAAEGHHKLALRFQQLFRQLEATVHIYFKDK